MKYYGPLILWMLVIFISSSIPSEDFPDVGFWGWSKLVHLFYYCMLCFFLVRVLRHQTRFAVFQIHPFVFAVLFAAIYGATDEFHQLFTPGRHGQVTDVLIDGFGACLFIGGVSLYQRYKSTKAQQDTRR